MHSLGRAITASILAWVCATGPVLAARADQDRERQTAWDDVDFCLPVKGKLSDGAPILRLAAPPLDPLHPNIAQGMLSRLLGPGASGKAAASAPESTLARVLQFGEPTPVVKRLIDGSADLLSGRTAAAEQTLRECVQLASKQSDSLAEAGCANNLAVAYAASGRPAQARSEFERALRLYETQRTPPANMGLPASIPVNPIMAGLKGLLDRLPPDQRAQMEARMREQQGAMAPQLDSAAQGVWRNADALNTRRGIELSQLNLGNLALASGQLAEAQKRLQSALDSHPAEENPQCRAAAAMDMARLYRLRKLGAEAEALLQRYPPKPPPAKKQPGGGDGDFSLVELGTISLAAADAGQARAGGEPMAAPAEAPPVDPTAPGTLSLNEPSNRFSGSSLTQLLADATRDSATMPPQQSMAAWQRLALRAAGGGRPDLGFSAHAALMRLHQSQGELAQAIFHGKSAANLAQDIRAHLADSSPSRDARRAFLRERRQVYVVLAQLLMDQQRLQEAEAALQLLKEDEGQQFVGDQGAALGILALTPAEQLRQRQQEDVLQELRRAEQNRLSASASLPIAGGAMLMLKPAQIEAARLKQALGLPRLSARLKREPWTTPGDDAMSQGMVHDIQALFLGPHPGIERALAHLIEDVPRFELPVSAEDRERLADIQKRLPQILAELAPLLRDGAAEGASFSISARPGGRSKTEPEAPKVWDYIGVEPTERMWRSLHQSDDIEARYLQRGADADSALASAAPPNAAGRDETLALLARQPVATALLYYLPGDDRLDMLLVGPSGRQHVRTALSRKALNASVEAFVKLLTHTERDPRPAARAMYEQLFAPVAQAVANTGARVIGLSLADKLRFVPFAALHDGQGWLVERYALALHPGGALAGRLKPASPNWRAAGFGASGGNAEFSPLADVRGEIAGVVRQSGATGGVLPGEAFIDQAFTAQRLRASLAGNNQVVHIASHFKFVGGDAAASYLLLGDGSTLSLRELSGPQYRFDRTELVTLSACTTGLSADDTYGQEVDGLAALLMGQGAPSVLASLWEVNDKSTASLMASLYRLRESQHLSRATALQQAQLAMIRAAGTAPEAAEATPTRGVSRVRLPGDPEPEPGDSAFSAPAALGYGHPFYWAPFVLMGDWL